MKATDSPFKNPILHHSNYQTIITNKVLILYNQYTHSKVLWIQIKSQYYHQNIFLQPKYHFKEKSSNGNEIKCCISSSINQT